MKRLLALFLSLRTAIWLLLALVLMLLFGSIMMPGRAEFSSINFMPLFGWLGENSTGITWWLYGSIILLALLTANTMACSAEALVKKQQRREWLLVISPQIIHIGFLFILLAHLLTSSGSFRGNAVAYEGSLLLLPNGLTLRVKQIAVNIDRSGYVSDLAADIEYFSGDIKIKEDSVKPNFPSFYRGLGIYLKDVQPYPFKAAMLEVSREPGALWAFVGAIFFMIGTVTLVLLKIKRESG